MIDVRVAVASSLLVPGSDCTFASFLRSQLIALANLGVSLVEIPIPTREPKSLVRSAVRIRSALTQQCDLLHVHYGSMGGMLGILCSWGFPSIVTFHGSDLLGLSRVEWKSPAKAAHLALGVGFSYLTAVRATEIVAVSEKVRDALPRDFDRSRTHIIPCGVDFSFFCPGDKERARRELGLSVSGPLVMFVDPGRPGKRFQLAKRALEIARKTIPDLDILKVSGIPNERMPLYLRACDALLLSSRSEGSPVITKEALACNLPVVSVDVGDVREQLEGVNGCVIVPASSAGLAAGLIEVLDHSVSCNGRELRQGLYDNRRVAGRLVELYRATIKNWHDQGSAAHENVGG